MRGYHLLPEKWAIKDLQARRLKLALLGDLNDPFEFLSASAANVQHGAGLDQIKAELTQATGLLCFSLDWSNPVLWSHYADGHKGLCLGFDIPDNAIRVNYVQKRFRLRKKAGQNDSPFETDGYKLLSRKYVHWKYEKEVRLLVTLDTAWRESNCYFVRFSSNLICLREVIIGMRSRLSIDDVRRHLSNEDQGVIIRKSDLASNSYEIVENLNVRSGKD